MSIDDALVMILAGGEGKRLYPLTKDRAKPAVPFGGRYRIIDFVLNNFINSGFYKIKVLTQYKSDSLNKHITRGWALSPFLNQYVDLCPAQMRTGNDWYRGTADAIYQNIFHITDEDPRYVCIFGGDHIYKMKVSQMLDFHKEKKADLSISAIPIPIEEASEFGIMEVDDDWRLVNFVEKPQTKPKSIPGHPELCLASMGNYIFDKEILLDSLNKDANIESSHHDFGKDVIPMMLSEGKNIYVYNFSSNSFPGMAPAEQGYWRDVGSIDAYWQANMDLLAYSPELNLYSKEWPLRTFNYNYPPAKFVWEEGDRVGMATNSMVSEGCIISGGGLSHCVLSPKVRINSYSSVTDSILMEQVEVGRYSQIRKAIIDKNVVIPPHTKIGFDREEDLKRGFHVSAGGVTVVPKGAIL
ncbi:MAG TPA: glucose-1-phosphate adenylyltransferase [Cyanobacteria bacterium UBA10660]|nr:glucose-1-phosphate adenylyltransferase [Clostridium sp. CAG:813]DAA82094.1 MAG TPA: glucose-1-phosphate adenylyltransferase [Candidatus Gastranaerophilales bacterium HUM_1]HAS93923.1 glucose-1-phosphate adenylyltransferase [Cyanobacteria bacterium UBA10660]